jgi:hypothetical protein
VPGKPAPPRWLGMPLVSVWLSLSFAARKGCMPGIGRFSTVISPLCSPNSRLRLLQTAFQTVQLWTHYQFRFRQSEQS